MEVIAIVRLAPGMIGFYDPLTGIRLTLSEPEAEVYEGGNYTRIRKAIANGELELVEGSILLKKPSSNRYK